MSKKNRELPKLHTVKKKEKDCMLLYHNHHPGLHNVQQWNLRILHRLQSHSAVQGTGIKVQSQEPSRVLHQSSRKKVEIVKSLASTFNLRIQLKNKK